MQNTFLLKYISPYFCWVSLLLRLLHFSTHRIHFIIFLLSCFPIITWSQGVSQRSSSELRVVSKHCKIGFLQSIVCNKLLPAGPCEPSSNVGAENASSTLNKDYWKGNGRQQKLKGKDFPKKSLSSDEKTKKLRCMWATEGARTLERENWGLEEIIGGKDWYTR